MQCWKCGGQTVGGVCTLCGGREGDRIPAATPAGRALRYVYDKFGARRTLTEDGVLVRCLGDVLPDEPELRRALTEAFAAGAGREFYAVLESNQPLTDASFQGLVRVLRAAEMSEKDAHTVLVTLWDMAGCGAPASTQPAPGPASQPVPNRPVEQPKYQPAEQPKYQPVERPMHPRTQKAETPAPEPVKANVDMRWHNLMCKVVWWLAPLLGLALLCGIDAYPYGEGLPDGPVQSRLVFTAIFLLWGFFVCKKLSGLQPNAYGLPAVYLTAIGALDAIHVIDLYNDSDFYSLVEYYQSGVTGCEEFAGLAWLFWLYCGACGVLFALAMYTGSYYKDPQRRALFDQK